MQHNTLLIPATDSTPRIELNLNDNKYVIEGVSLPFNASDLYNPVLRWLKAEGDNVGHNAMFEINISYYNTPTSLMISKVLQSIEMLNNNGTRIIVRWTYQDEDDMADIVSDFCPGVKIPFEFTKSKATKKTHITPRTSFNSYSGETDKLLIKKCSAIIGQISRLSNNENKGAAIDDIYNALEYEVPREEIEYIISIVSQAEQSIIAPTVLKTGAKGYALK